MRRKDEQSDEGKKRRGWSRDNRDTHSSQCVTSDAGNGARPRSNGSVEHLEVDRSPGGSECEGRRVNDTVRPTVPTSSDGSDPRRREGGIAQRAPRRLARSLGRDRCRHDEKSACCFGEVGVELPPRNPIDEDRNAEQGYGDDSVGDRPRVKCRFPDGVGHHREERDRAQREREQDPASRSKCSPNSTARRCVELPGSHIELREFRLRDLEPPLDVGRRRGGNVAGPAPKLGNRGQGQGHRSAAVGTGAREHQRRGCLGAMTNPMRVGCSRSRKGAESKRTGLCSGESPNPGLETAVAECDGRRGGEAVLAAWTMLSKTEREFLSVVSVRSWAARGWQGPRCDTARLGGTSVG